MKMTTKLLSLLTILFVFFKFGKPAQVMMSIYGDRSFLYHSDNLVAGQIIGFVYENTDGGFALANCSATPDKTYFTLSTDCTVIPTDAVTVATTATDESGLKLQSAANFPATGTSTNMMVATPMANRIAITTTTNLAKANALLLTITAVITTASNVAADTDATKFLCNNLTETYSGTFFTPLTTQGDTNFGQVNHVTTNKDNYLPIMKCVGAVRNIASAQTKRSAFATFILIVTDHTDLTDRFNSFTFSSVVLLPKSTNQTTAASTVVGYINGKDACPSGNNVTFSASTGPCKGTISINTKGNYSFGYNGTTYYLPVTDASGETTCPATSTTTCEDFAFNFKYSNTLIGMLLIFMLKMLQSY